MYSSFRYPTKQQSIIWMKRRLQIPPSIIADELKVSRPFVSQAQRIAEQRIKNLLITAAQMNRVQIDNISPKYGFAVGYSPASESKTYITYSPESRVQVWFDHKGDCQKCELASECDKILRGLAVEWELSLPRDMMPTEVAKTLFARIMGRLGWDQVK